nr:sec1 family transport protein SLY1-like [Tanacetum cinerariifolium]
MAESENRSPQQPPHVHTGHGFMQASKSSMVDLNQTINASGTANEKVYKIMIFDNFCQDILSPLIHVKDLCKHGETLYFFIDKNVQKETERVGSGSIEALGVGSSDMDGAIRLRIAHGHHAATEFLADKNTGLDLESEQQLFSSMVSS